VTDLPERNTPWRSDLLISAVLVFLVLIAFEPVRHNAFVEFDDNQYLVENTNVQSGFTARSVAWAFTSGYASNWHPLTWLSHMLDVELFKGNPFGHHLHNLFLHAVSVVLLFLVLKSMTRAIWPSAFAAVLFGIHPLRVESVAWAAERKDLLCAVFWMLTIAAYLHYVKGRSLGRYLLVMGALVLGLMAKPMIVSLPLVLLVLDFWPLRRVSGGRCQVSGEDGGADRPSHFGPRTSLLNLVLEKVPLFILVAASCVVTYLVQRQGKSVTLDLPVAIRVSNALSSYVAYLGKLFWPSNLAVLYPYPVKWPLWKPIMAASFLVLTSALLRRKGSQQPYLAAGWLWYLISLLPVIGIVQVGAQSMADRYTYLPSIGIFIMIAWGLAALSVNWRYRKETLAISSALVVITLMSLTRTQVSCWKDSLALFGHAVAVTENNYTMHHSLGWALARANRLDEAAFHLNRSLQLRPDAETHLDMADVLIKRRHFEEALTHLHVVLNAEPTNVIAHYDLGILLQAQGEPDKAINAYEQAVRLDRNHSGAFNNLGILKTEKGQLAEAAECFHQSIRIAPDKAPAHRNLAAVLLMQDQTREAAEQYRTALRIDPNDEESCWNLAYTLHCLRQLEEAALYDRRTLQLKPDHVPALNDLAWILATTADRKIQNPAEAIRLAHRASELTDWKEPAILDTLATAYASAYRFREATETAQRALDLATAAGQEDLNREIQKRLQLYKASTPYIETLPALPATR
jgi:protein O-mannosyl-transferase